jgi:hypothetical protein
MQEVEAAIERLTKAVGRLEAAAAGRVAERQRLTSALEREQKGKAQLELLRDDMAGRLDGAIDRLRAALGE